MSLLIHEMRKIFLVQRGLLWISLFFVFSMITLFVFDTPKNPEIEMNKEQYSYYLKQVHGSLTDEIEIFLKSESSKISDANIALEKAYNDFYDGRITENELLAAIAPFEKVTRNEKGFELIFDQYTYIRENPANRYFILTNGWDGLLSTDRLDLIFLLLILILVTPVFCSEYTSEMNSLHLTVKKGTRIHVFSKVLVVSITVVSLCILTSLLRYGFFHLKYGLENGDYPLQSLTYFGTSTKNISIFSTFIGISLLKIFGNLSFAIMVMLISVWTKKYALTLFTSTIIILLPYYGFTLESSKYFLPGPLGFMISSGFFKGSEYEYNVFTDQFDVIYEEVPISTLFILFTITLFINIAAIIFILMKHTNAWSVRRKFKFTRMQLLSTFLTFIAVVTFGLVGCTHPDEGERMSEVYNYSSRHSYENEQYLIYVDETDLDNVRLVFEDKQTKEKKNFIRNPMQFLTRVENSIYGKGNFVYYMKFEYEKSGFRDFEEPHRFFIVEVDTRTFNERIVFEKNVNLQKDSFLGLNTTEIADVSLYSEIDAFFLDDKNIYFVGQDEIRQLNRLTGESTIIIRYPVLRSLAFDGEHIYYINDKYEVVKYDTKTHSDTVISDIITTHFILTDTELLYLNRKEDYKIYSMDLDDFTNKKITNQSVLTFTCDAQYIYYESKEDPQKYRIDRDGENEILLNNVIPN